jgi:hypothetical protein
MRRGKTTLWAAAILVLAGTSASTAAEIDLDARIAKTDRTTAARLVGVAKKAERGGQGATATRILKRALELDPEQRTARRLLGFVRRRGGWTRAPEERSRVELREDVDARAAAEFRALRFEEEDRRADGVLRTCRLAEMPEGARERLAGLLAYSPRHAGVHEALGHERIGDNWVRPELVDAVRRMPSVLRSWAACRAAGGNPTRLPENITLPGARGVLVAHRVGERVVGATFPPEVAKPLAASTEPPYALLRTLLGPDVDTWRRPRVYFLNRASYMGVIRERHADEAVADRRMRTATYACRDFFAVRMARPSRGTDLFAHSVGFWSMQRLVAPDIPDDPNERRDRHVYAWVKEGTGYLVTLELFDTATSWFFSRKESSGKVRFTVPPPEEKNRETCLAWVRDLMLDGTSPSLRNVLGRTLNNLDLLGSLEAWTFVRFLAFHDPVALRKLPEALRKRTGGSSAKRSEEALVEVTGLSLDELESRWRAFVLEIR